MNKEKGDVMDIETKRGRSSLEYERIAIEKFSLAYPDQRFIDTPKHRPAAVDGVFMKQGALSAVTEIKTRILTREKLRNEFEDKWLITADKVDAGRTLSRLLRIPFVGLLYLIPDETLLVLRVTDSTGQWSFEFERRKTITKRTINGGEAERLNAFLPLATAKEIP